ncbi:MAG: agmatinase family protein [Bacteroidales bacterium]
MRKKKFNPNSVAIPNGNYFAFPYSYEESNICLLSIPWDVTTSYGEGTANGPEAILEASTQLDFFDFDIERAWELPCYTLPINHCIKENSQRFKKIAKEIILKEEQGISLSDPDIKELLKEVNKECKILNNQIEDECDKLLKDKKIVGLIGGDHSTPLGLIKALTKKHESFGILHIDAHADLRKSYEGFKYSHASIMYNALEYPQISKLIQVGIRDLCQEEHNYIEKEARINLFDDGTISQLQFEGQSFSKICDQIIAHLPEHVYISFDIDGLEPSLCPNTGTPVPGGLTFNQAMHILRTLMHSGREIIGFDLCEVSPGNNEWDANVGARILYKLCSITGIQCRKN